MSTSLNSESPRPALLYVAAQLPKRSETFVYREVLGLRQRGYQVTAASVRSPETNLGTAALDELAAQAVVVYQGGWWWQGLIECLKNPRLLWRMLGDALGRHDVRGISGRLKIIAQGLGGLSLARRLRGANVAVTHVHAHMAHVPTTIAMYAAAGLGVPFSFTGHAADLFRDRQLLVTKLQRAAFVSCISYWHREFYREALRDAGINLEDKPEGSMGRNAGGDVGGNAGGNVGGAGGGRLPVVRCGVPSDGDGAEATHTTTGKTTSELTLLTVGRLVPKKGVGPLLQAWAKLSERGQLHTDDGRWRLVIVGDGPEEKSLRELATSLGIDEHVSFLGAQNNDCVRQHMAQCDMFILNCQPAQDGDRDGIPVVLMEAMAASKCAISGDLPAIRELIEHDKSGVMVNAGQAEELAQTLVSLMTDKNRRDQLGQAGRAQIAREFSLEGNLDRLTAAFSQAGNLS